jgi:hypothetical protein
MAKTPTTDPAAAAAKPETETTSAKTSAANKGFTVTRELVVHDGEPYVNGDTIYLTKAQHAQLFAVGAVSEAWTD